MKTSNQFVLTSASGVLVNDNGNYKTSCIENYESNQDFLNEIVFFNTREEAESFKEQHEFFGLSVNEFAGVDAY